MIKFPIAEIIIIIAVIIIAVLLVNLTAFVSNEIEQINIKKVYI